jgi:hypothetical protein
LALGGGLAFTSHNPRCLKIGPSVNIDMPSFDLRFFHSFLSLYGVEKENGIRDYHILGIDWE